MIMEKALWGSVCILQLCFYRLFQGHGHGFGGGIFLDVLVRVMEFRLPNDTSSLSLAGVMSTTQHSGSVIRFHMWRLRRQVLFQRSHNFPLTSQQFFFLVIITALLSWLISLRWLQAAKPSPWVNVGLSTRSQTKVLTGGLEWPWSVASVALGWMDTKGKFYIGHKEDWCASYSHVGKNDGSHS